MAKLYSASGQERTFADLSAMGELKTFAIAFTCFIQG